MVAKGLCESLNLLPLPHPPTHLPREHGLPSLSYCSLCCRLTGLSLLSIMAGALLPRGLYTCCFGYLKFVDDILPPSGLGRNLIFFHETSLITIFTSLTDSSPHPLPIVHTHAGASYPTSLPPPPILSFS